MVFDARHEMPGLIGMSTLARLATGSRLGCRGIDAATCDAPAEGRSGGCDGAELAGARLGTVGDVVPPIAASVSPPGGTRFVDSRSHGGIGPGSERDRTSDWL
jgi:hypothetical protein